MTSNLDLRRSVQCLRLRFNELDTVFHKFAPPSSRGNCRKAHINQVMTAAGLMITFANKADL